MYIYPYRSSFYPSAVFRGFVNGEIIWFLKVTTLSVTITNKITTFTVQEMTFIMPWGNSKSEINQIVNDTETVC